MQAVLVFAVIAAVLLFGKQALAAAPEEAPAVDTSDPFFAFDALFRKYGRQFGVPWRWLKAIAMNESSLGQDARVKAGQVSSDGLSYGLMQVTLKTFQWLNDKYEWGYDGTAAELNNPEISVQASARYLAWVIENYFDLDDRESVIRAYNGGPGFQNTAQGQRDTPVYYARFVRNLNQVLARQPGNELERG